MVKQIDISELKLNFKRLAKGRYYKIGQVFAPADYDWYGDKERRALLAFVSHYRISGKAIPCMKKMIRNILQGQKKSLTSTSTVGV